MQNTTKGPLVKCAERVDWLHKQLPVIFPQRSTTQMTVSEVIKVKDSDVNCEGYMNHKHG